MPSFKRKRASSTYKRTPYAKRAASASKRGRTGYANVLRSSLNKRVNNLYKMIETKESGAGNPTNVQLPHNNVTILSLNPLATTQGAGDPMTAIGQRIGDSINVVGLSAKIFLEGALARSKVYFRVMLLKGARGASFSRSDIYKGAAANKMLDDINTEKYTVVSQKIVTVTPPNTGAYSITGLTGVPVSPTASGITGNRILKFWIPGKKFGKNGRIVYEDGTANPKFFDYRWVIVAYDWYGTPQDTNNVGVVNEFYSKMYFKDA